MNDISEIAMRQATFTKTQLLPLLTPKMMAGRGGAVFLANVWPHAKAQPAPLGLGRSRATLQLPRGAAEKNVFEWILFGLLAVSAAVGIGQMLAAMIELAPNWPRFEAGLARLLG